MQNFESEVLIKKISKFFALFGRKIPSRNIFPFIFSSRETHSQKKVLLKVQIKIQFSFGRKDFQITFSRRNT